ncbi:MAG: tetratricopeptide repeat protein [Pirellulales bacterium]
MTSALAKPAAGQLRSNQDTARPPRIERRFDVRFFVMSAVVAAIVGAAGYGWYRFQQSRLVDVVLEQARRQLAAEKWTAARSTLENAFSLSPNEPEAIVMMAQVHDRLLSAGGRVSGVVAWYYRAMGMAPDRHDLRLRLAELLIDSGQFEMARRETEYLLQHAPDVTAAAKWDALARLGLYRTQRDGRSDDIRQRLTKYFDQHPNDLRVASDLAYFLRDDLGAASGTPLAQEADAVLNRAVDSDAGNADAYVTRYRYRDRFDLEGADSDLARALELAPKNATVVATAAAYRTRLRDYAAAERLYRQLMEIAPTSPAGLLGLGDVHFRQQQMQEAVAAWELGLKKSKPRDVELNLRLAEGYTELRRFQEADQKLRLLENMRSSAAPTQDTQQRWWFETSLELLRGKWHLRQGDYRHAVPLLRQAARSTERLKLAGNTVNELATNALILLSEAYRLHDHRMLAAETLEEAFRRDRSQANLGLSLAEAWAAAGREDRAKALAHELLERPSPPAGAFLLLAQLELNEQLLRIPIERDWRTVDQTLTEAEQILPNSWRVQLLKARLGIAKRGVDSMGSILQLLLSLEKEHENDVEFWKNLVLTYDQLGRTEAADRAMARLEQIDNSSLDSRLLRAQLLIRRGDIETAQRILDATEKTLSPAESVERQHQLDQLRWMIVARQGDGAELQSLLRKLHARYPSDIRPVVALAEAALSGRRFDECKEWEGVLAGLEDEDQAYTAYFQVRRMLAQHQVTPDVKELVQRLARVRTSWAYVAELQAELHEAEGQIDEAIAAYKRSIAQGNDHFRVHSELIRLLYQQKRYAEAEVCFDLMQGLTRPQQELKQHNVPAVSPPAAELAPQQAVTEQPGSALARVWLGQSMAINGQVDQARAELEQAVAVQPDLAIGWVALTSFSARVDGSAQTEELLKRIAEQSPLDDEQKQFVLGFGYELLGRRQEAVEHYQVARQENPAQPEYLIRLASCLLNREPKRAEEYLREAVKIDPRNVQARRLLASVLAQSGADATRGEVRDLLSSSNDDLTSWRMQAVLLAERNQLPEAVDLFQQIVQRPTAQPQDWLMLADLQQQMGRDDLAYETMVDLSQQPNAGPRDLSTAMEFFLTHDKGDDAQKIWQSLAPNIEDPWTRLSYEVRLAYLQGRTSEIDPQVTAFVEKMRSQAQPDAARSGEENEEDQDPSEPEGPASWYVKAARLFEQVGDTDRAENWYRRLATEYPDQQGLLALHLAKHADVDQALAMTVDGMRRELTVDGAILLARILLYSPSGSAANADAESVLTQALNQFADQPELTFAVANLRLRQHRLEDAVQLLRQTVALDPGHMLAWNNLAAVLAETAAGRAEALECVQRAIDAAGYELPTLLDTKGVVLLQQGDAATALPLLAAAAGQSGSADPRFYFHLAQAHDRLGQTSEAAEALELARRHGLPTRYLTQAEQQSLTEMTSRLAAGQPATTP